MTDAWTSVREQLVAELGALRAGDALVLSEPEPPAADERRGLLGRFKRAPRPQVRYVQYLRQEDGYAAECVSSAYWSSTPEQQQALVESGWSEPGSIDAYPTDNYARHFPLDERRLAADAGVAALATLGCAPGTAWMWDRITE